MSTHDWRQIGLPCPPTGTAHHWHRSVNNYTSVSKMFYVSVSPFSCLQKMGPTHILARPPTEENFQLATATHRRLWGFSTDHAGFGAEMINPDKFYKFGQMPQGIHSNSWIQWHSQTFQSFTHSHTHIDMEKNWTADLCVGNALVKQRGTYSMQGLSKLRDLMLNMCPDLLAWRIGVLHGDGEECIST